MAYIEEPVPPEVIESILKSDWDPLGGTTPQPAIINANVAEEAYARINLRQADHLIIRTDVSGETEELRASYKFRDVRYKVEIQLLTMKNRQRLYNLKKVVRKVLYGRMHDTTTTGYQLIRYESFVESVQEQLNVWMGTITVSFESTGIPAGDII